MCNPREITVTATRQIDEAWQHAITRTIELAGRVTGEARVRERLDASLSTGVLRALEIALADASSGWTSIDGGFRQDVEGGYVTYHIDDRTLEIVATVSDELQAVATAEAAIGGRVTAEVEAEAVGHYYGDGYANRTEEVGRREATAEAQRLLDQKKLDLINQAKRDAESAAAGNVESEARQKAAQDLERRAAERLPELETAARRHLDAVGMRARQIFYRALGSAYRDAILAYARRNGADGITCHETGDTVEIEFLVQK